ncbi:DVU_1557 family redox protein [Desulfoscipio sp. XC116]|uniref:DVU_1557 family redox protein n=1 Tax=Desulfoscipio sp. XC116 TaxID=3144975 RepID=UPI00325B7FE4
MAGKDMQAEGVFQCLKCNMPMEPGKVTVSYMGSDFPVELLRCKKCGFVLITEELALGKMLEVEKTLEDK